MELDPRFCEPDALKSSDKVTIVELDQSWRCHAQSPTTFIEVNKSCQCLGIGNDRLIEYRDQRLRIHIGCKQALY